MLTFILVCMVCFQGALSARPSELSGWIAVGVRGQMKVLSCRELSFNPLHPEATFVQKEKCKDFLKTILTLPCQYSLDGYC